MQEDFRLAKLIVNALEMASRPGSVSQVDLLYLIENHGGQHMTMEELQRGLHRLEHSNTVQEIVETHRKPGRGPS